MPVTSDPPAGITLQTRQPTVLLADDEPALLNLMAIKLRRLGWQIHTAPDAATAIEIADRLSCHLNLLITDVDMPGMPGDQLIRKIPTCLPVC